MKKEFILILKNSISGVTEKFENLTIAQAAELEDELKGFGKVEILKMEG